MRQSHTRSGFPAGNPIANALVVIAGILAIGASIVLGFFAFIVLASIVLITAAIIGIRVWWFNRKHGRKAPARRTAASPRVIEGEFHEVQRRDDGA